MLGPSCNKSCPADKNLTARGKPSTMVSARMACKDGRQHFRQLLTTHALRNNPRTHANKHTHVRHQHTRTTRHTNTRTYDNNTHVLTVEGDESQHAGQRRRRRRGRRRRRKITKLHSLSSPSSGELLANRYAKRFPRARRVETAPHCAPTPPKGGREGNAFAPPSPPERQTRPSRQPTKAPESTPAA